MSELTRAKRRPRLMPRAYYAYIWKTCEMLAHHTKHVHAQTKKARRSIDVGIRDNPHKNAILNDLDEAQDDLHQAYVALYNAARFAQEHAQSRADE